MHYYDDDRSGHCYKLSAREIASVDSNTSCKNSPVEMLLAAAPPTLWTAGFPHSGRSERRIAHQSHVHCAQWKIKKNILRAAGAAFYGHKLSSSLVIPGEMVVRGIYYWVG